MPDISLRNQKAEHALAQIQKTDDQVEMRWVNQLEFSDSDQPQMRGLELSHF